MFGELDEDLQKELIAYLAARGVTEELGSYLFTLLYDKEQREYMRWLERLRKFVTSK